MHNTNNSPINITGEQLIARLDRQHVEHLALQAATARLRRRPRSATCENCGKHFDFTIRRACDDCETELPR